jgi:hypothetical protein
MCRRGRNGPKPFPRITVGSNRSWLILAGCSCLWIVLVVCTAHDFLVSETGFAVSEDYSSLFLFRSPKTSPTLHDGEDCRGSNGAKTTRQKHNATTSKEEIRALFDRWNDALITGDPAAVAELYFDAQDETTPRTTQKRDEDEKNNRSILLLPTLSNEPRTNLASVENYFAAFLKRKPRGKIVSGQILIGPDGSWAHDAGIYEFVLQQQQMSSAPLDNHRVASATSPSNNEPKQSGGAAAVVDDKSPKNRQEPKSSIVVRARYSFLYLRDEKGEWKIAHHHSSLMPESD